MNNKKNKTINPPSRSRGLFSDIWNFLILQPRVDTHLRIRDEQDRDNFNKRILQRLGITPDGYTILNIHQIGVNTPASYVFNELLDWSGNCPCWPNHLALTDRMDPRLQNIRILPFGWSKYPLGMKSLLGLKLIPLFNLNILRIKNLPDPFDFDNARYLLYQCTGGYPIGFFSMYVRSSIPELGEKEQSQLFIIVGFDFYGREDLSKRKLMKGLWEVIHNRVTANVIYRLKQMCEWSLDDLNRQADLLEHL